MTGPAIVRFSAFLFGASVASGCVAGHTEAPPPRGPSRAHAGPDSSTTPQWMLSDAAPDFSLEDLAGNVVSLESLRGQIVVVHFGTSWCPYCYAEAPHLEALADEYEPHGVRTLVIDVAESAEKAAHYKDAARYSCPVLLDRDGAVAEKYAPPNVLPSLPRKHVPIASNLIIDRDGKIRFFTLLDSVRFDAELVELRATLDEMLDEEVVAANVEPVRLRPGGDVDARIRVRVADGFHVQANPAASPRLVPLEVRVESGGGVTLRNARYPQPRELQLAGTRDPLLVYGGAFTVPVTVEANADAAPGERFLTASIAYQACDHRSCRYPASLPLRILVDVAATN